MHAIVEGYSARVSVPSIRETDTTATYKPLLEKLVFTDGDVADVAQKLRLILKGGVKPALITIFEPERTR